MKRMTLYLAQTVLIILILLTGCKAWNEFILALGGDSRQTIPEIDSLEGTGKLGSCSVSIKNVYLWRDWQPIVENPGEDGGSPLYVSTGLHIDNSKGSATKLSWKAYAFEPTSKKYYSLELLDKNGSPAWNGKIGDSEVKKPNLMTHDGPHLSVGTSLILVIRMENQSGETLWVKSEKSTIEQTF